MIDIPVIIAFLTFLFILILGIWINNYLISYQDHKDMTQRFKKMDKTMRPDTNQITLTQSPLKNDFIKFFYYLGNIIRPTDDNISKLRLVFLRAGIRHESAPVLFYGVKIFLASLLPLMLFFFNVIGVRGFSYFHGIFFYFFVMVIGFFLPNLALHRKISKRQDQILECLPEAIDLMVVCVEVGISLDAAINRVGEEIKLKSKELSDEFKLLNLELRAGKSRQDALKSFAQRINLESVNSLVALLIQTDIFGTSVSRALHVHADSMRTMRFQKAEEMASKLPVKLLFPLIFFILPALFVVLIGPAAIRIYRNLFSAFF